MASRMKEDERNEKIIRGLLKLPANRRCINCNNLGPQYVCTNFWTFICTNCSGLHREFCHRVKSISMAKFTTQEVNALQEGGNERAKGIYFKEFDPHRHPVPDSSNIDRLRDFIKHVYVDRRFSGERNTDKPPRGKADKDDFNESNPYRGDSRSPPYDDQYSERPGTVGRNGDRTGRFMYGERSPASDQGDNKRSPRPGSDQGDNKRSPRQFEVVDDRVRDDRSVTGNQIRRFEDRRLPDVVIKPEGSSPSRLKEVSSPPIVRPVRDILGDGMPQLHVGDSSKSNNTKVPDMSAQTQRASSSSTLGSSDGGSTVQLKRVNSGSLIDFTVDLEPSVSAATQQPAPQQNTLPPPNGRDWASFDNTGQQKAPQAAANVGTLDSALAQLSTPGPAPSTHMPTMPSLSVDASPKSNDGGQWPTVQQHQTSQSPSGHNQPVNPHFNAPIARAQSWGSTTMPNTQGPLPNIGGYTSQVASTQPQETNAGVYSKPSSMDAKPVGRKALPEDLFTSLYPSVPISVPGWQSVPHPGIAYGMQYGMHYPMGTMFQPQTMPIFPHPSKSKNPFELGSEPALNNAPMFPSVAPLQGALPQMSGPSPLLRSTSFGNPSPHLVAQQQSPFPQAIAQQQSPFPQAIAQQQSPFPQAMSQGQYMGQQVPASMPQQHNMAMMGHQGTGGPGTPSAPRGHLGMDRRYSLPSTPSSFGTSGGNPFG